MLLSLELELPQWVWWGQKSTSCPGSRPEASWCLGMKALLSKASLSLVTCPAASMQDVSRKKMNNIPEATRPLAGLS